MFSIDWNSVSGRAFFWLSYLRNYPHQYKVMLSFPLLVIINHTNIKLAVRRAKIGLFHLSHIICVSASFVAICPPNRRIFWDMASKHTKGCFFYSQIERTLNLNNYCQMSVWRSFREIELNIAKCEKKLLLFERLRTFCMFSDKTKQKNSKFAVSWQFLQTGFDKLMI